MDTLVWLLVRKTKYYVVTSRSRENCHDLTNDAFKFEHNFVLFQISLEFATNVPIKNNAALVRQMGWGVSGDKPIPESMMVWLTDELGCVK